MKLSTPVPKNRTSMQNSDDPSSPLCGNHRHIVIKISNDQPKVLEVELSAAVTTKLHANGVMNSSVTDL